MTAQSIKDFFAEQIASTRDYYVQDLEAMSEEVLARSPGGEARTPYDFTHEVAIVNRHTARRIRGEESVFPGSNGWIKAPPEACSKSAAIEDVRASMNDLLAAWNALPAEDILSPIQVKNGETNAMRCVSMCIYHAGYHDAQLNYLQSMQGDIEVHWQ